MEHHHVLGGCLPSPPLSTGFRLSPSSSPDGYLMPCGPKGYGRGIWALYTIFCWTAALLFACLVVGLDAFMTRWHWESIETVDWWHFPSDLPFDH